MSKILDLFRGGGGGGNSDAIRQSTTLTMAYLIEQNRKFEFYMRQKLDELEARVSAQQARQSDFDSIEEEDEEPTEETTGGQLHQRSTADAPTVPTIPILETEEVLMLTSDSLLEDDAEGSEDVHQEEVKAPEGAAVVNPDPPGWDVLFGLVPAPDDSGSTVEPENLDGDEEETGPGGEAGQEAAEPENFDGDEEEGGPDGEAGQEAAEPENLDGDEEEAGPGGEADQEAAEPENFDGDEEEGEADQEAAEPENLVGDEEETDPDGEADQTGETDQEAIVEPENLVGDEEEESDLLLPGWVTAHLLGSDKQKADGVKA